MFVPIARQLNTLYQIGIDDKVFTEIVETPEGRGRPT
jgi:hypothetical protein